MKIKNLIYSTVIALGCTTVTWQALGQGKSNDGDYSGNAWLSTCQNSSAWHQGMCLGYAIGVYDGMQAQSIIDKSKLSYCIPDEATNKQIKDVFIKYMENHPEIRHDNGLFLYIDAMRASFPCPTSK